MCLIRRMRRYKFHGMYWNVIIVIKISFVWKEGCISSVSGIMDVYYRGMNNSTELCSTHFYVILLIRKSIKHSHFPKFFFFNFCFDKLAFFKTNILLHVRITFIFLLDLQIKISIQNQAPKSTNNTKMKLTFAYILFIWRGWSSDAISFIKTDG